ncbi:ABC transporter ATP-binding protein [Priestia koreensis]|uniref:Sugar ABC transporter ATP-binding protein n=2 Tax=Bacteria TaxID=2 RepID=A0A0M0KVK1_9BACI|nr:ATP-binding cassette domain-containing protein [Priestia koreensis]KOO42844.1 sugar ABC transporter ATP-binding protein [Priestia koreensis]MCM3005403.1 ATP-binding cassette domain-containing protein [Priestia koreensis]
MIEVKNISKNYRIFERDPGLKGAIKSLFHRKFQVKTAVHNVSFTIPKGEIIGYIGSNGAGKSTTIKMISGILTPDEGEITVNGIVPYKDRMENAKIIGAVFGQRTQLFWDIPVQESLQLLKHIYEIPEEQYQKNLAVFRDVLDLDPLLSIPVRQLSLGQKMRCELAAAFLHNPSVVYLDEPTIGLDASVKIKIRQFIKEMNKRYETTIILTTHDMQDIEELCHRVIILDKGIVIYDGSLLGLKQRTTFNRMIELEVEGDLDHFPLPASLQGSVEVERKDDQKLVLYFNTAQISVAVIMKAIMEAYPVVDFTVTEPSIESIVQEIYEREVKQCESTGTY